MNAEIGTFTASAVLMIGLFALAFRGRREDASQGRHRPPRMAKASPVPLLPRYLSDSR